jgi:hypothetical protein
MWEFDRSGASVHHIHTLCSNPLVYMWTFYSLWEFGLLFNSANQPCPTLVKESPHHTWGTLVVRITNFLLLKLCSLVIVIRTMVCRLLNCPSIRLNMYEMHAMTWSTLITPTKDLHLSCRHIIVYMLKCHISVLFVYSYFLFINAGRYLLLRPPLQKRHISS